MDVPRDTGAAPDASGTGRAGAWSMALALVAAAGVVLIGVTSTTPFTPGDAFLTVTSLVAVVSWVASVVLGIASLRGRGRRRAVSGLILSILSLAAFVVLLNVAA